MNPFEGFELGRTTNSVKIDSAEQQAMAARMLAEQSRMNIDILSRELDPAAYDTPEFVDAVKKLALRSRHSQIRLLIVDGKAVVARGHRLADLAATLSTFIRIRATPEALKTFNESIMLVDSIGYIHRFSAERFEGIVCFNDAQSAKLLQDQFNEAWEHGKPDPNFRRLIL